MFFTPGVYIFMGLLRFLRFFSFSSKNSEGLKNDYSALQMDEEEIYDLIASSNLFDPDFYRLTYGDNISHMDPLLHFLEIGLDRGYLPSENFDPVLYRLTVPECGQYNPLLHYLKIGKGSSLPQIAELFPDLILKYKKKNKPNKSRQLKQDRIERYIEHCKNLSEERQIDFSIGEDIYTIKIPSIEFFLDRFRNDQPFTFARLPHGFWDALVRREEIAADQRLEQLSSNHRRVMAVRIQREALPHHGGLFEAFFDETQDLIGIQRDSSSFFNAIAFKGFFDQDDGLFRPKANEHFKTARFNLFSSLFKPSEHFFDATSWKRFADKGQLEELPNVCRNRHVILLGADFFHDLNARWEVNRFTHVEIELSLSQRYRWQILERLKSAITAAIEEGGPHPVLLTMCGGSFAYWLFCHLYDWRPDVFYLDLGQSLRIWYPEIEKNGPWMKLHLAADALQG